MRSIAALLFVVGACNPFDRVHDVPLEGGDFVSDDLNEPKTRSGVALNVDLARGTATLTDGADHVALTLTREPDHARWEGDCGTMSGHSMLELARVSPTSFTLRGEHFSFDTLRAECGAGVRLEEAANHDVNHECDRL